MGLTRCYKTECFFTFIGIYMYITLHFTLHTRAHTHTFHL